jgi:hypothetical protein
MTATTPLTTNRLTSTIPIHPALLCTIPQASITSPTKAEEGKDLGVQEKGSLFHTEWMIGDQ